VKTPRPALRQWWPIYSAGLVACLAVTAMAWLLAISPSLDQLHQRAHRLQELSERRQKSAKLTASLGALRRKQAGTVQAINQLDLRLDSANNANARMAAMTRLANDCQLTVDEVKPGQTLAFGQYQTLAMTLSGTGTYPAIARLLHRMHQEMRDTALESMDLSPENGSAANSGVRFRLDFVWYAAPESARNAPAPVAATE